MSNNNDIRKFDSLLCTAYHEAGHAVCAHILGINFRSITIKPSEDSIGQVTCEPWRKSFRADTIDRTDENEEVRRFIIFLGAGPKAESIFTGQEYVGNEDDYDLDLAADFAEYVTGDYASYVDKLWEEARRIIGEPRAWRAVRELATYLLVHEEVCHDRATEIIQGAL
jgi:hypothetical protein